MLSKIITFFYLLIRFEVSKIIYNLLIFIGVKKEANIAVFFNYKFRKYPKDQIFFFHISKCAGTALSDVFNEINQKSNINILRFGHAVKSKHVNFSKKNRYIVNIREPLDRFLSAFYARKKSPNLIDKNEINCFENFPDANLLAESLTSTNLTTKNNALYAMKKIKLVNHNYSQWFNIDFINKHQPFFIFEQENIEKDFKRFCKKINFNKNIELKVVNKNKIFPKKTILTKKSTENLKNYMKEDIKIYNKLLNLKSIIN